MIPIWSFHLSSRYRQGLWRSHLPSMRVAGAAYLSEMESMEFYERLEKESSGEAALIFRKLKDMEKGHMDITKNDIWL